MQQQSGPAVSVPFAGPWDADALSRFLEAAHAHTRAAFGEEQQLCGALVEVDALFRTVVEHLGGAAEPLAGSLFIRAHGRFLGAVSLALSGLVAESYALLNRSLAAALQGVFVAADPVRQQYWMNRNNDDAARDLMRVEFRTANLRRHFRQTDSATAMVCETLMRRTSDHSDHPNTYADPFRKPAQNGDAFDVDEEYFVAGGEVQRYCLRTAAQTGICVLSMFFHVFPDQYREAGIPERLTQLRRGH
jgi:hypothetical protein